MRLSAPTSSGRLRYGVVAVRGFERALDYREARRREARKKRIRRSLLVGALLGTAALGASRIVGGERP
jgi:hypothetical protein